jgi:hypothetical protein
MTLYEELCEGAKRAAASSEAWGQSRNAVTYRGWICRYDPPPVSWRSFDWCGVRDSDDLNCHGKTLASLCAEIDCIEAEEAA